MTLREYVTAKEKWLRGKRHPKTVNETRVSVEAFCDWHGGDIDVDDVTPKLVEQFEAAEETTRRRQLVSNLLSLLRLYDPDSFPRRTKSAFAFVVNAQKGIEAYNDTLLACLLNFRFVPLFATCT